MSLKEIVKRLNAMMKVDPESIRVLYSLVASVDRCVLADATSFVCSRIDGKDTFTFVGLLNGLFSDGDSWIAAVLDDQSGKLKEFKVLKDADVPKQTFKD